jgi:hypothetical protein
VGIRRARRTGLGSAGLGGAEQGRARKVGGADFNCLSLTDK